MAKDILRAVAYLKQDLTNEPAVGPVVELSGGDRPVFKNLGNGLLVAYLIDTGDEFDVVQFRDIQAAGITQSELHEIGLTNLGKLADEAPLRIVPYHDIYVVLAEGNFEASMMLLDDLWDNYMRQFVSGDYLGALPSRDVFSFCDAACVRGREQLLATIDKLRDYPDHRLSQSLYRRLGNHWEKETDGPTLDQ